MTELPSTRILRLLAPDCGGERKFSVIAGIFRDRKLALIALANLRKAKLVRFRHCRGGGRWGLTKDGLAKAATL